MHKLNQESRPSRVQVAFDQAKEEAVVSYLKVPADIVINNSSQLAGDSLERLFAKCQPYRDEARKLLQDHEGRALQQIDVLCRHSGPQGATTVLGLAGKNGNTILKAAFVALFSPLLSASALVSRFLSKLGYILPTLVKVSGR